MNDHLTPDTTLALLQASQGDAAKVAKNAKSYKELAKVEEAAREFEAVFVAEMMKPMFEGISTDGLFGGGKGEEVFRGMMVQEYGKILSQTGQIGISNAVKDEMIRMQESLNKRMDPEVFDEAAAHNEIAGIQDLEVLSETRPLTAQTTEGLNE